MQWHAGYFDWRARASLSVESRGRRAFELDGRQVTSYGHVQDIDVVRRLQPPDARFLLEFVVTEMQRFDFVVKLLRNAGRRREITEYRYIVGKSFS